MLDQIKEIKREFDSDVRAGIEPGKLRVKYLRRKSELSRVLRSLSTLPLSQRKTVGEAANKLRKEILTAISQRRGAILPASVDLDLTLPGLPPPIGALHPVTLVEQEVRRIFEKMGFAAFEGPEVETDYYNFEALNMPPGHPARDMWDTFYLGTRNATEKNAERDGSFRVSPRPRPRQSALLLRTHISSMQVRVMEKHKPPLAVISSGRVFRHEATDARHEHTWDYMEGFAVGEHLSLAHLKFVLEKCLKDFFGKDVKTQMRPSYFPFVEPGVEMLMSCIFCNNTGCRVCGSGWLEMLGAGMIHPAVFAAAGYQADAYTGFAFGLGLSRFAMMKYNISDIRVLYQNDLRRLPAFSSY